MADALASAFEVDSLYVGELVGVITGVADPAVANIDAPAGSIYLRTNGEVWSKTGPITNQWTQLGTGSGGGSLFGNVDGGLSNTNYGSLLPVDGGSSVG